jgi:hypothetical protein
MRKMRGGWYLSSWYEPVYRQNFWLTVGATGDQVEKWARKDLHCEVRGNEIGGFGCVIPFDLETDGFFGCLIWLAKWEPNPQMLSTVAHEAVHAADFTLGDICGVARGESFDKNEAYAYYVGYITKKILEELASKPDVVSGEYIKKNHKKRCRR